MSRAPLPYLLDTGIVLIGTREESAAAIAIEQQFQFLQSPFKPMVCEVTVAELLAFARGEKWGEARWEKLQRMIDNLLVIPIGHSAIYREWANLKTYAKSKGLPVFHDENDLWIAATAKVASLSLISTDAKGFRPLRDAGLLSVELVDSKTGALVP